MRRQLARALGDAAAAAGASGAGDGAEQLALASGPRGGELLALAWRRVAGMVEVAH